MKLSILQVPVNRISVFVNRFRKKAGKMFTQRPAPFGRRGHLGDTLTRVVSLGDRSARGPSALEPLKAKFSLFTLT